MYTLIVTPKSQTHDLLGLLASAHSELHSFEATVSTAALIEMQYILASYSYTPHLCSLLKQLRLLKSGLA